VIVVKRATEQQLDEFFAEALRIQDAEPTPVRRKLKRGEAVEIPEIGLPGATLSGTEVLVDEYPDGTICALIPKPTILIHALLALLVFREHDKMSGDVLRFIRRTMSLTQAELAAKIGTSREKVTRMETGSIPVTISDAGAIRHHGAMFWLRELNVTPESQKLLSDALGLPTETATPTASTRRGTRKGEVGRSYPLEVSRNYCVGFASRN
jgi:transcriptional regulator with XRE-family HTH domain